LHTSDENGYRQNSGQTTYSLNGSIGLKEQLANSFIDYSIFHVKSGMPGSITKAQFELDPRLSQYTNSKNEQTKEGFRIRPGFTYQINSELELSTDASLSFERQNSAFPDFDQDSYPTGSKQSRDITTYSFNPKLKWNTVLANMPNSLVVGFDFYKGRFDSQTNGILQMAGANDYKSTANQETKSIYLQNTLSITPSVDAVIGLRYSDLNQKAHQDAYCSVVGTTLPTCTVKYNHYAPYDPTEFWGNYADGNPSVDGKSNVTKNAYHLALNYHEDNWGAYAKHGTNFRFANLDELFGFNNQHLPIFYGNMLKPQTGRNTEIGVNFANSVTQIRVAIYQNELKDEIAYNNYSMLNTNLDPTVHRGIETQFSYQLLESLKTKLSYTHAESTFRSGVYKNHDIPGVPNDIANLQLIFNGNTYGKYIAKLNYVGSSYFSNDLINDGNKQNSYTTLDLKASWDLAPFTLDITALNVLDKKYYTYGLTNSSHSSYLIYPANGQSIYASIKYDFK
jgi:iron complex outermembrane receptor protein